MAKPPKGKTINELITPRQMEVKSVEELLGVKVPEDTRHKPVIPGKFDLIIPPGTPRKLIINMAKELDLEMVIRTDVYVPIGISDIQREILVIRGDERTIRKVEKILFDRLTEFVGDDGIGQQTDFGDLPRRQKSAAKTAAKKAGKAKAVN